MTTNEKTDSPPYASMAARVGAGTIDVLFFSVCAVPFNYLIYGDRLWDTQQVVLGPAHFIISNVIPAILIIFGWNLLGTTPGGKVLRLRVLDAESGRFPNQVQCIMRLAGVVATIVTMGLGMVVMVFD